MCEQFEHEKRIIAQTARAEMKLKIIREFSKFVMEKKTKKTKKEVEQFVDKIRNL